MVGYKTWAAGDILTASDVNGYLRDQIVPIFATTTARDAAILSPVDGQFAYSQADDAYYVHNGTTWLVFDTAWKSWTPTLTGVTLGSGGTTSATYCRIGKTVIATIAITLGGTGSITGDVTFTIPVTAASVDRAAATGDATITDASPSATYPGAVLLTSTTVAGIRVFNAAGTYASNTALSGTIPITFTSSDKISATIIYEAA